MTLLAVPLVTWSISPLDEVASPTARRFQSEGGKGICLNCPSAYERDSVYRFLAGTYPTHFFHSFVIDDDDLPGYGNADLPEAEIWLPADADEKPLYDFLATIPPRTVEITTAEYTDAMEELLQGVNHLVIEYEDDIDFDVVGYLISLEDNAGLVSQLRQLAA